MTAAPDLGFDSQMMKFLADYIGCKLVGGLRVTYEEPFVLILCCGDSLSIYDVIHPELYIDPRVTVRASS